MNSRKILIIIITLYNIISYKLNAQALPYQYLDSISKTISALQSSANGMTILSDTAEVSFPEENFSISPATLLATHSTYLKKMEKRPYTIVKI